jgi:hypothetical protein
MGLAISWAIFQVTLILCSQTHVATLPKSLLIPSVVIFSCKTLRYKSKEHFKRKALCSGEKTG